jgi:hypothetical protein
LGFASMRKVNWQFLREGFLKLFSFNSKNII